MSSYGPNHKPRTQPLPDGWTMSAKGLWHHESGARVENTGRRALAFEARNADGERAYRNTKTEAMSWAVSS